MASGVNPVMLLTCICLAAGLACLCAWWLRVPLKFPSVQRVNVERADSKERFGLAAAGAVAGILVTGWPVMVVYLAAAGWFLPTFRAGRAQSAAVTDFVDAVAVWVGGLRDNAVAGSDTRRAVLDSTEFAPDLISDDIALLVSEVRNDGLTVGLRRFATTMEHPLIDFIVAALLLTERQDGDVRTVLSQIAEEARDFSTMWRQVEAGRSGTFAEVRVVGWISFAAIGAMLVASRQFLEPFGEQPGGSIALLIIGGLFFGAGVALHRLGVQKQADRFFRGVETWQTPAHSESKEVQ